MEEEIGDFQCPREHGRYTKIIRRLLIGYGMLFWMFIIQCSCSPIITSHYGFVIKVNTHQVCVEHERSDKPGYGVVRVYKFPFGHDFVLGDSICIAPKYY